MGWTRRGSHSRGSLYFLAVARASLASTWHPMCKHEVCFTRLRSIQILDGEQCGSPAYNCHSRTVVDPCHTPLAPSVTAVLDNNHIALQVSSPTQSRFRHSPQSGQFQISGNVRSSWRGQE